VVRLVAKGEVKVVKVRLFYGSVPDARRYCTYCICCIVHIV